MTSPCHDMHSFICVFLVLSITFFPFTNAGLRAYFSMDDFSGGFSGPARSSYCSDLPGNLPTLREEGTASFRSRTNFGTTGFVNSSGEGFVTTPFSIPSTNQLVENQGTFSYNAWYRLDLDTAVPNPILLSKSCCSGPGFMLLYFRNYASADPIPLDINFATSAGIDDNIIDIPRSLVNQRWFMLTITYDTNEVRVYIDGALQVAYPALPGNGLFLDDDKKRFTIGNHGPTVYYQNFPCGGELDEVMFFDHPLSQPEVIDLFSLGHSLFDNEFQVYSNGSLSGETTSAGYPKYQAISSIPFEELEAVSTSSFIPNTPPLNYSWGVDCTSGEVEFNISNGIKASARMIDIGDTLIYVDVLIDGLICRRAYASMDVTPLQPSIDESPAENVDVTIGRVNELSVILRGSPPPNVQWQERQDYVPPDNSTRRRRRRIRQLNGPEGPLPTWSYARGSVFGNDTNTSEPEYTWVSIPGATNATYSFVPSAGDTGRVVRALVFAFGAQVSTNGTELRAIPPDSPESSAKDESFPAPLVGGAIGGGVLGMCLFATLCVCLPVCFIIFIIAVIISLVGALFSTRKRVGSLSHELKERDAVWEIDYGELEMGSKLGSGAYGTVFRATFRECDVAVKQLNLKDSDRSEFLAEAKLMKRMRAHLNVVRLYGVCTHPSNPLCLITEFMPGGDLLTFLRSHGIPEDPLINRMALDVAAGMVHLIKEGIIHRDLAARNLLLTSDMTIKVSDFGMSQAVADTHTSVISDDEVGPLKWMSPECLETRKFSEKSDVYAYGVTLVEILSGGASPYPGKRPVEVAVEVVREGLRPEIPVDSHPVLAEIMQKCFARNPRDRPTFRTIHHEIKSQLGDEMLSRDGITSVAGTKSMATHTYDSTDHYASAPKSQIEEEKDFIYA